MTVLSLLTSMLAFVLVFVPIDDRPATSQFPRLIAQIAGVRLAEPPMELLGNYLNPGDPDAILDWLRNAPIDTQAFVVSSDMIAYGGLVASRIPQTSLQDARSRLAALASIRTSHSLAAFTVFGTVMRLAPTGVPAMGPAANFPFSGSVWPKIQKYANLPYPPETAEQRADAARLRKELGPALDAYLATRSRNLAVDLDLLRYDSRGAFDAVVLGQDDAGPVGLALPDLQALFSYARQAMPYGRWAIEPGTDELGMVSVAQAIVRQAGIVPRVRVIYSRADGGSVQDPLEFAPIATTIFDIITSSGGVEVSASAPADVDLYINVPNTSTADEKTFTDSIAGDPYRAAVADLSFIDARSYAVQERLMNELIAHNVAGRVLSFASWNTTANTVGTAIPEAFAVLAGKRMNTYNAEAHRTFTYMRYVDDIVFQKVVRPRVNADLSKNGVADHTYLLPPVAARAAANNDALLRPLASDLLLKTNPAHRIVRMAITLPWDRTFEEKLSVRLTP
jgi:hypothetical protein